MSKTKIYNWQHAPEAPGEQKLVDATPQPAVAVAPVVSVEAPSMPTHTVLLGSFVVKEALAKLPASALANPQRAAAETWAAGAAPGSRTMLIADAAELGVPRELLGAPPPSAASIVARSKPSPPLKAKLRVRGDSTTRLIAGFRQLQLSQTLRVRVCVAGLAALCALGGFYLGKPAPQNTSTAAAPEPLLATAAAPLPQPLPPLPPTAASAASPAEKERPGGGVPSERQAIDALIAGDRTLAISHYRALAVHRPGQRAFAAAADILGKRSAQRE